MPAPRFTPLASALLVAFALSPRAARADDFVEDTQLWAPTVLQVVVVPARVRAYFEVQPRLFDDAGRLGLVLYRPALSFQVVEGLTLWGGYAYAERHFPRPYAGEHRGWTQVQLVHGLGEGGPPVRLLHRLRLEQRVRRHESELAHRLRWMLRGQAPLAGAEDGPRLLGIVWNELFMNLNTVDWGPLSGFDRNRSFFGVGVQAIPQVRVETGYVAEVVHARGPRDEQLHHVAFVGLFVDLP